MTATYTNIHGRKGSRGIRPLFLIPKVLAVAMLVGGTASALGLMWGMPVATPGQMYVTMLAVRAVYQWVILPGLMLAIGTGIALLFQHPGVFIRQRWVQLKLVLVFVTLPGLHLWARSVYFQLEEQVLVPGAAGGAAAGFRSLRGITTIIVVALVLTVFLGRHKPRIVLGRKSS